MEGHKGHHGHRFNPDHANKLLNKEREENLPFDKISEIMQLGQQDVVADLGAGNGFFTIPIAQHTKGRVYAVDIEPKMLEVLKTRAGENNIANIYCLISDLDQTQIEDQSIDKVLISMVLHEVPSIDDTLNEIKRMLKPDGIVVFIEWAAVKSEDGPPQHIRISSDGLARILQRSGFETTVYELNSLNYAVRAKLI